MKRLINGKQTLKLALVYYIKGAFYYAMMGLISGLLYWNGENLMNNTFSLQNIFPLDVIFISAWLYFFFYIAKAPLFILTFFILISVLCNPSRNNVHYKIFFSILAAIFIVVLFYFVASGKILQSITAIEIIVGLSTWSAIFFPLRNISRDFLLASQKSKT